MRFICVLLGCILAARAIGLDLCPAYSKVHEADVASRLKTGIPFRMLSVAYTDNGPVQRTLRLHLDLWTEKVSIEVLGGEQRWTSWSSVSGEVCNALSPATKGAKVNRVDVLINPGPSLTIERLSNEIRKNSQGIVRVDLKRLAESLRAEKVLFSVEGAAE